MRESTSTCVWAGKILVRVPEDQAQGYLRKGVKEIGSVAFYRKGMAAQGFALPAEQRRLSGEAEGKRRQQRITLAAPDGSAVQLRVGHPDAGGPGLILRIFEEMVDRHSLVEIQIFRPGRGFGPLLASGLREECADGRMAGGAFFFFRRCFFCPFLQYAGIQPEPVVCAEVGKIQERGVVCEPENGGDPGRIVARKGGAPLLTDCAGLGNKTFLLWNA